MKKYKKYQYCTDLIKKKHAIRWFEIKEWIQGTKIRNLKWKKFKGQFLKEFYSKATITISNTATTSFKSNIKDINHGATRNIKFKSKYSQWQWNSEQHYSNA